MHDGTVRLAMAACRHELWLTYVMFGERPERWKSPRPAARQRGGRIGAACCSHREFAGEAAGDRPITCAYEGHNYDTELSDSNCIRADLVVRNRRRAKSQDQGDDRRQKRSDDL